jgi:hypothetical protein
MNDLCPEEVNEMAKKRSGKSRVEKKSGKRERLTIEQIEGSTVWKVIDTDSSESPGDRTGNGALNKPVAGAAGNSASPEGKVNERSFREIVQPPPPSPLRGILPTPEAVNRMVDSVLADRPASPGYRQMLTDFHKLRYYFGGHWIAYRNTPQGKEVLAVGHEETGRLLRKCTPAERRTIVSADIDLWQDLDSSDSP